MSVLPFLDDGSPAALQHFQESLQWFPPQINIWSLSDTRTLHAQPLHGANNIPWPSCLCCLLFSRRGDGLVCRFVHVGHRSFLWREKRQVRAENTTTNIQVCKCASRRSRWRSDQSAISQTARLNDLMIKNRYLDAIKHISRIRTLLTACTEILIVPEHACASCLLFQI